MKIKVFFIAVLFLAGHSRSETLWPQKTIHLWVGFAPGGPTDLVARTFANKLSVELEQQVIVESKAGAGGSLAANFVAKAQSDGYTLLLGEPGSILINNFQMKGRSYDPIKEFTPIAQVVSLPLVLAASPALKVSTLKELILLAKSNEIPFGTPGKGTMQHLTMSEWGKASHSNFMHIAYKGGAPAVSDLLGGQIPLVMVTVPSVVSYVKSGAIVPLAVMANSRSAVLPNTPTFLESGFSDFIQDGWQGFFAPAQLSKDIVQKLSTAIMKVGNQVDLQSNMNSIGANVVLSGSQEFTKVVLRDSAYWSRVVLDNPSAKE